MNPNAVLWTGVAIFTASSVIAFYLTARLMKVTESRKVQRRILGKELGKGRGTGPRTQSLVTQEDPSKGKFALSMLRRFNLVPVLSEWIEQAGLRWHPARVLHTSAASFLLGFIFCHRLAPGQHSAALLLSTLGALWPLLLVHRKRKARLRRFESQFPEALEFLARAMRAGHAFSISVEMLHKEFPDPLGGEFRRTFEEHNLGAPIEVCLQKLARRVPLLDVQMFVSAVVLQKRTGGNLAELLEKLAFLIRERFKLRGKIRSITAHGRMTALTLTFVPIGVALALFAVNRDYLTFFFLDPAGRTLAILAVGLQVLGLWLIQKIVSIEI